MKALFSRSHVGIAISLLVLLSASSLATAQTLSAPGGPDCAGRAALRDGIVDDPDPVPRVTLKTKNADRMVAFVGVVDVPAGPENRWVPVLVYDPVRRTFVGVESFPASLIRGRHATWGADGLLRLPLGPGYERRGY